MIVRKKVEDDRGRLWVRGLLDSDDYFDEVRRQARTRARREVAAQLDRAVRRPRRPSPA